MQNTKECKIANNRTCWLHSNVSREEIAKRAFQIYLAEGCPTGRALDNWCEAEYEYEQEQSDHTPTSCGCGHSVLCNKHS